jgi:hypothetical protein
MGKNRGTAVKNLKENGYSENGKNVMIEEQKEDM